MLKRRTLLLGVLLAALTATLALVLVRERRTFEPGGTTRPGAGSTPQDERHVDARVLFLGNSFTYVNDLPALVRGLAKADHKVIATDMYALGGAKLDQHARDPRARALLLQRWDVLVLQEQSQTPELTTERRLKTIPAVKAMRDDAAKHGAKTVLFATWAYRDGDAPARDHDTYESMQARLDVGFDDMSQSADVPISPVNKAFALTHADHPDWPLWAEDGRHPSLEGSYLAACVVYESILSGDVRPNMFTAAVPEARARALRELAHRAKPYGESPSQRR